MGTSVKPAAQPRTRGPHAVVRPRRRRSPWLLLLLILGLAVLALVTAVTAFQLRFANRVFYGVRVQGIDLSELTLDQAAARLEHELTPYPGPTIMLQDDFEGNIQTWNVSAAELGVKVDARATARQAYQLGRAEDPRQALREQWDLLRYGMQVTPTLTFGAAQAAFSLDRVARLVDRPVRDASVSIEDVQVIATPSQVGRRTDLEATWAAVQRQLLSGQSGTVQLVVHEIQPTIASVAEVAEQARQVLSAPLTMAYAGEADAGESPQSWAIDQAELARWLSFVPKTNDQGQVTYALAVDSGPIQAYVQNLAPSLARPARDARLDFNPADGQVSVLTPSQAGRSLEVSATISSVLSAIDMGNHTVDLPVQLVKPAIDMHDIDQMGIKELVASGTTTFKGSSAARVANIARGTKEFVGVVIPPDGVFSFNQVVGDVSAANGYEDSLIIAGDRTAVGVGGGICQVSTTVFRAAFWGGFPIVERWAHGYVVSWYGEPGMDATIFTPSVDFRFKNDSGAYLLVKPDLNLQKGTLTFNFYGTKPNRVVEKIGPEISNVRKPPPPLYQEDSSLAPGQRTQVDWAVDGRDAVVKRIIKQDGQVIREDKFVSKYQPWRAVFLVGPTAGSSTGDSSAGG